MLLRVRRHSSSRLGIKEADLPTSSAYRLKQTNPTVCQHNLLRPHIALNQSTGILTRFPSTTHFCLALGADSPYADERCVGNLGLSASGLFTRFIVTYVSIRTSDTSSMPHSTPSQAYRTLPYPTTHKRRCRSFGAWFSPVTSSAQADSTSELLRFL